MVDVERVVLLALRFLVVVEYVPGVVVVNVVFFVAFLVVVVVVLLGLVFITVE